MSLMSPSQSTDCYFYDMRFVIGNALGLLFCVGAAMSDLPNAHNRGRPAPTTIDKLSQAKREFFLCYYDVLRSNASSAMQLYSELQQDIAAANERLGTSRRKSAVDPMKSDSKPSDRGSLICALVDKHPAGVTTDEIFQYLKSIHLSEPRGSLTTRLSRLVDNGLITRVTRGRFSPVKT
jgi:hypothetical protein